MTNKMWVDVNTAADILKVSISTVKRKIRSGQLSYRRLGERLIQINRSSICFDCLKEIHPEVKTPPCDCKKCTFFTPKQRS